MHSGVNILLATVLFAGLLSCGKADDTAPSLTAVQLAAPYGFPEPEAAQDNPLTAEGIALGRMLFYDVRLSGNNQVSCATCHNQQQAFTDGVALATHGVSGTQLLRHAPALVNLAWMKELFWDGGSLNLESQAFGPLSAEDEMNQALPLLVQELKAVPDYVQRFKRVFGTEVTSAGIVKALAQFQRTLISSNSRYDKYTRAEAGGTLTTAELKGLQLVRAKCASCHAGELFTDNNYHNNGLDADFSNTEHENLLQGRYRISYEKADMGKYKTPTLRNCMLTAPYMHDGRLASIEAVLQHYNTGVKISATTDAHVMQNGGKAGIPLTQEDKTHIIAFLHTLTDSAFINNKNFSSPF